MKNRHSHYGIAKPAPPMLTAADSIMSEVAATHLITMDQLTGPCRAAKFIAARREAAKRLRSTGLSFPAIGRILKRDHTTIINLVHHTKTKIRA